MVVNISKECPSNVSFWETLQNQMRHFACHVSCLDAFEAKVLPVHVSQVSWVKKAEFDKLGSENGVGLDRIFHV